MHGEYDSIRELAYHLWKARGCPTGSPEQDWLDAERQLSSSEPAVPDAPAAAAAARTVSRRRAAKTRQTPKPDARN